MRPIARVAGEWWSDLGNDEHFAAVYYYVTWFVTTDAPITIKRW